jgi:ketosteroid isomerase-like protein
VVTAESSMALVRELFARFNGGDPNSILELLTEDFVAEVPPSMSAEPDVYEGRDGVLRYMQAFEGLMEDVRFEPVEFHEHGDTPVVELLLVGRGATSGIEVAQRAVVIVWVDHGKVRRIQPFPDLDAAWEHLRSVE